MERRMLLAVVLSFLCVTAWSALTGQGCVPRPPKEDPAKNGEETPGNGNGNQGDPNKPDQPDPNGAAKPPQDPNGNGAKPPKDPKPPADPDTAHPQKDVPETSVTLESKELKVVFSSRGGGVEWVALKNHKENGEGQLLDLVVPADIEHLLGHIDDTGVKPSVAPGGAGRKDGAIGALRRLNWTRNTAAETGGKDVVFDFTTPDGVTYRKRWSLVDEEDRYDIRLELSATGGNDESVRVRLLASAGQMVEPRKGMDMFGPKQCVVLPTGLDEPESGAHIVFGHPLVEFETEGVTRTRLRLLGSRSLYFATLLYSDAGPEKPTPLWCWVTGEEAAKQKPMQKRLIDWYAAKPRERDAFSAPDVPNELGTRIKRSALNMQYAWATYDLPTAADAQPLEFSWYTGPIDRETLGQDGYESLERMIEYPFAPDVVAQILLGIYDIFRSLFGSIGLAVIFMTLTVRGLMMPLSIRNQLSMRNYSRKIQKIKPKLTALQEKFKKNPRKLREEQMKLYRENNIGFPGGCLMMIVQIPIWFALFSSLRREFTIRGAEFLWISDLSGPDTLIDFGGCFPLLILTICGLNLLPILMVTLSIIHTRSMPKPQDDQTAQQYKMMKWMPIIFAVILYNYTAALMLYMTLSSGFGIVEAKIVRAKDDKAKEAAPA